MSGRGPPRRSHVNPKTSTASRHPKSVACGERISPMASPQNPRNRRERLLAVRGRSNNTHSAVGVRPPFRQREAPGGRWTYACGRVWSGKAISSEDMVKRQGTPGQGATRISEVSTIWMAVGLYAPSTGQDSGSQREQSHVDLGKNFPPG